MKICGYLTRGALALIATLGVSAPILAQSYPAKPVKIIVGVAPGASVDHTARLIAQRLSSTMGQQFIVENKPGAGSTIAYAIGVKSPPDGYTLTLITVTYTINPSVYKLKFDPVNDITPIVQIAQGPQLFVVNPSVPAKSIGDLIALAKSRPGKLNYAYAGQGGISHLAAELFASMAGVKINGIPYKGGAPALTDTVAGQTEIAVSSFSSALPYVKSGKLRALAVTTSKRVASAPDIPTVEESGLPGYEVVQWYGLIGPKGLPSSIVARLNGEVAKALELKQMAEQLQIEGMSAVGGPPEQFQAMLTKEIPLWRRVVTDIGLKVE